MYNNIMKLVTVIAALSLSGCVHIATEPVDVALIPNDCANQRAITAYLETVTNTPPSRFVDQQRYEQYVSNAKNRMWRLRYHCNRR